MAIKQTLIFATNNQHKVDEIRSILDEEFMVISLKEAGIDIDIPEPFLTLEANASQKSKTIHELTHQNCFSEDTGLEVDALHGAPGVKSARYAGEGKNFAANIEKLLATMKGKEDRKARFRTVISLIWHNKEYLFEGVSEGKIVDMQRGENGFCIYPVFFADGM
jgi:XTP/dITP diphosphohydrolase